MWTMRQPGTHEGELQVVTTLSHVQGASRGNGTKLPRLGSGEEAAPGSYIGKTSSDEPSSLPSTPCAVFSASLPYTHAEESWSIATTTTRLKTMGVTINVAVTRSRSPGANKS